MAASEGRSSGKAAAGAMGVTEAEILRRKEFLEFSDEDVERLSSIGDLSKEYADPVIESFYAHLLSFEEMAAFFSGPNVIEHVKQKQKEYFLGLTAGDFGEAYVENRLSIGAVHERMGVPLEAYLGMYSFYLRTVAARLNEDLENDPGRATEVFQSLMKLVFFDIGLAIDTYVFQRDSLLEQQMDAETRREKQAAEQALAASEERFRQLLANVPDAIVRLRLTPELVFEYVSTAIETISGYTPEELYAQPEIVFSLTVRSISSTTDSIGAV